jgi:hypothetical protein
MGVDHRVSEISIKKTKTTPSAPKPKHVPAEKTVTIPTPNYTKLRDEKIRSEYNDYVEPDLKELNDKWKLPDKHNTNECYDEMLEIQQRGAQATVPKIVEDIKYRNDWVDNNDAAIKKLKAAKYMAKQSFLKTAEGPDKVMKKEEMERTTLPCSKHSKDQTK